MSDIVERLRGWLHMPPADTVRLMDEAADEIERLEAEVARLTAALQMIIDEAARDGSSPRGHYIARAALNGEKE